MVSIAKRVQSAVSGFRSPEGGYLPNPKRSIRALVKELSPFIAEALREDGNPLWNMVNTKAYVEDGFESNSVIYSAVMYKAKAISYAPLRAYSGDSLNPKPLPKTDPLARLCLRPNPFQSWNQFFALSMVFIDVSGDSFVLKLREKGNETGLPSALLNLESNRVKIIPNENKTAVIGYLYIPEGKSQKDGIPILPEDMIHTKYPNPSDPLKGMGYGYPPLGAVARSADVDNKVTEVLQLFFQRGMMLTALLKFDIALNDDQVDLIKERWDKMYGGYENWTSVGVLDKNGSFQRMTPTFKEMGFDDIDSRNETRMLGPLGVPPILIGTRTGLKHATYSNYGQAREAFWDDTLIPQLGWFETNLEYHLTDERSFVSFDLSRVPALQRRRAEQVETAHKMWGMGVPANVAFQQAGLDVPEIEGGDVGFLPSSVKPVDAVINPPAPPAPPPQITPSADDADDVPLLDEPDDEEGKFLRIPLLKKKRIG